MEAAYDFSSCLLPEQQIAQETDKLLHHLHGLSLVSPDAYFGWFTVLSMDVQNDF